MAALSVFVAPKLGDSFVRPVGSGHNSALSAGAPRSALQEDMPLLARLWTLLIIAILPAIGVLIYNEHDLRRAREAQMHEEVLLYARAASDELERIVDGARDLLLTIASAPAVRDANWTGCNEYLAELGNAYGAYSRLTIADDQGRIVCASEPIPPGQSMAERPYFRQAAAGQEFAIGQFTIGRHSGDALLPFAMPFRDRTGRIAGAVIVGLRLGWLTDRVERKALPPSGSLLIADSAGTILTRSPEPDRWIGQQIRGAWRPFFEASRPGTTDVTGPDGVRRICGYIPPRASPLGLHVVAGVSTAQAFTAIETASRRGLALVALAGAVALVAALLGGRYFILRPIGRLLAATSALERGTYDRRVGAELDAEFGQLARAFDTMAATLAAREGALRASEAEFRAIFEMASLGKSVADAETRRFLRVNRAFCEMTGYNAEELLARTSRDIIHPDDWEADAAAMGRLIAGQDAAYDREKRYIRKDGRVIWGRANIVLLRERDGQPARTMAVIEDVTRHKQAEEALREAEMRYRLAARATNDVIWDWDVATNRVSWNEAVGHLFGYTEAEISPTVQWWRDRLHPDDHARVLDGVRVAIQGADQTWSAEYRFRKADGSWADVLDRGFLVRNPEGLVVRMIGAILDLTERKSAERRLKLLMAEVDHRAKNMLARVLVLVRTTRADTVQDFVKTTQGRIHALARAHALLAGSRWSGADLRRLVEEELAPFRTDEERVRLVGPYVTLTPKGAQALAIVLHELATNATKYGALSRLSGRVDVVWMLDRHCLTLRWTETGGPPAHPPAQRGTGTTVIERSVRHELDGSVRFNWGADGLACTLFIPAEKLAQMPASA